MSIAIYLAAGKGARIGAAANEKPKSLLNIGGISILERSLRAVAGRGVKTAIIVTGYGGDSIENALERRLENVDIQYIRNESWGEGDSMLSLEAAVGAANGNGQPMLVMEADLLYDPGYLDALMEDPRENLILTASHSGSGDEVFVCVDENERLIYLGKSAPPEKQARSVGELTGISKIGPDALREFGELSRKYRGEGRTDFCYYDLFLQLSANGTPFFVKPCPGLFWMEVDTAEDLKAARSLSRAFQLD